jgi:preprotein translocase subunit SecF
MKYNFKFSNFFIKLNYMSLTFFILSVSFILFKGLNYGIDFKGGTLLEIEVESKNITTADLRSSLNNLELGDVNVKNFGKENHYLIKIEKNLNNNKSLIMEIKSELNKSLGEKINYRRIENVGPKVSSELLKSGIISICLALIAMLFYIWVRFEWQFSLGSIVALTHDVIITLGIFSILSIEINLSIVAAVLTIVGYSMNDTVVIFDRVRENLKKHISIKIFELTNISINETLSRTIITSVTTMLALLSIYILGGEILKGFSLAMILGVVFGTYSSIYIANPTLVYLKVSYKTVAKEDK